MNARSQVSRWLEEKGFSIRTIELLSEQDAAMLFSLSKQKLVEVRKPSIFEAQSLVEGVRPGGGLARVLTDARAKETKRCE